jgi:hypothetical protein
VEGSTAGAAHAAVAEEEHNSAGLVQDSHRARMQEAGKAAVLAEGKQDSLSCTEVVGKGLSSIPEEEEGCQMEERSRTPEGIPGHSPVAAAVASIVLDTSFLEICSAV